MARSIRSFAFFVLAILALANAQSVNHGFISNIDRQTSPYFLSFRADLSALNSLTGINVFYSIGITAGSSAVLGWTQINNPQAVNTIVETFATPLPDDYTIYINLKTVDTNNGNAEQVYSSASLKVGNRLTSDPTCNAIFNPVGTSTQTPPQPVITIEYDNDQQLFHFDIVAKYLLQGYTWVIDFAPFTGDATKGTKGLAATNCENRQTADLSGRNFAEFWNAAPAADYSGALNSKNYLAYRLGSAGTPKWSVSATGCDKVTYTTPGFSFNDLLSCKQADGTTPSIIRTIVGNSIQYNGTLYVTAVKAINPLDESAGFQTVQFTMPFFVSFSVSSTSISSGTDNNIFAFSISSLYIQADGNLALSLATNAMNNGFYLTSPSITAEPNNVDLASDNTPSNVQKQTWNFKSTTPVTDYSGAYSISFTRTDGAATQTVTAQFTLSLAVTNSYNNNGLTLPTVLSFWDSNAFTNTQQKTSYTSLDTIYVRSTVTVQNNQDQNSYDNSVYNVWLCYTVDNSAPVYDPANNQLGCTAQTWNIRPLSRLVLNGQITSGVLEDQFATTLYDNINNLASVNTGLSFSAAPLATLKSGTFYIQIESKINLPAKKRSLMGEQASSHEIQPFAISADATIPKTPIASSAPVAQVCAAAVALFGGLLLL